MRISESEIQRWLNDRHGSIGGSEAAAIFGKSPWDSPFSIYCKKSGLVESEKPTTRLKVGLMMEPVLRDLTMDYLEKQDAGRYELITSAHDMVAELAENWSLSLEVYGKRRDSGVLMVKNDKYPRCHATPDGLLKDNQTGKLWVWEAKTCTEYLRQEWKGDQPPAYYEAQARHNAAVMELPGTYMSALIGFGDDQYRFVPRGRFAENDLRTIGTWYENHVVGQNPPEAGYQDYGTLKKLYATGGGPVMRADQMDRALVKKASEIDAKYQTLLRIKERAERKYEDLRSKMKQVMGDSEELILPSGARWTWKKNSRSRPLKRHKSETE